jgi:hypothetical protein
MTNQACQNTIPEVIPMTQTSFDENGNVVTRHVKPLTYALISFVKVNLGLQDTVDISDDELSAQWSFEYKFDNEKFNIHIFINVNEESGIISLDIYPTGFEINNLNPEFLIDFIIETNIDLAIGQFQFSGGHFRYHSSIDVEGIASLDPAYTGPHLIHPQLIVNMFNYGQTAIGNAINQLSQNSY